MIIFTWSWDPTDNFHFDAGMTRDPLRHWPLLQCDTLCLTEALLQHLTAAENRRNICTFTYFHQICHSKKSISQSGIMY